MKTTIKKLIKLGISEENLKKELDMDNEKFEKYKKQGRKIKVDNVPELLEKYNGNKAERDIILSTNKDLEISKILDEIYELSGKDKLLLTPKEKADIVLNIPNFVDNIRKEIGYTKIKELEEEINKIKSNIETVKYEYGISDGSNICKTIRLTYKQDVKLLTNQYELGNLKCGFRMSYDLFNKINEKDVLQITDIQQDKKAIYEYIVT